MSRGIALRTASSFTSKTARLLAKSKITPASKQKNDSAAINEQDRESLRQVLTAVRAGESFVFYEWSNKRITRLIHAAAFFQLLLWLNGAWLAIDYLTRSEATTPSNSEVDTSSIEASSVHQVNNESSDRVLAPFWRRAAVATGLTVLGCGISASLVLYASRFVTRLQLLSRGDVFRLETGGIPWLSKPRQFSVSNVMLRERIWTGQGDNGITKIGSSPFLSLRVQGENMGYIMDRSVGRFSNPRALDALIYRPLQPIKKN
ncbi:hypothetical protein BDF22DRAFT_652782 [Syncephalis plumigaleata]|nr:hypothetical protein BDF22DRAFT_652782 [Syncephalis plumigaleata]